MEYIAYVETPYKEKIWNFGAQTEWAGGEYLWGNYFHTEIPESGCSAWNRRVFPPVASLGVFEGKAGYLSCNGSTSPSGRKRKTGVFATRSPFRPNSIGLSCVKLEKVRIDQKLGPVLTVSGLDLLDHTPLFDIKPYLPYVDAHPEAKNGFAEEFREFQIPVVFPEELQAQIPEHLRGTAS